MVTHCTEDEPVDHGTLSLSPWTGENPEPKVLDIAARIASEMARQISLDIDADILKSIQQLTALGESI